MTSKQRRNFWEKVLKGEKAEDCWVWIGSINWTGRGMFRLGNHLKQAHRVSYLIAHGPIPDGFDILHKCNNKKCVNPDHLYAGTQIENSRDALGSGTLGPQKLTWEQVDEIRALYAKGINQPTIAKKFGVCQSNIHRIVQYKSWRTWKRPRRSPETG